MIPTRTPESPPPLGPRSNSDRHPLAETPYLPVFQAYVELAESRTGPERVAVLERLYRTGIEDGTRATEEAFGRSWAESAEPMADTLANRITAPVRTEVDGVDPRPRWSRPPPAMDRRP